MRKLTLALLVTLLCGALLNANAQQTATAAGDPHMTADERAQVIKWMNDTREGLSRPPRTCERGAMELAARAVSLDGR
jgi:hypothetical protein